MKTVKLSNDSRRAMQKILLAPDQSLALPNDLASQKPGTICSIGLANEAFATQETFSEPLTNYAIGYRDPENNQALVNYLFPDVQVGRRFEFKKGINAEEFFTELDDVRGIGAEFKRVEYSGETQLGKTLNKGLAYRIDRDLIGSNDEADISRFSNMVVAKLLRRLWRNEAIRAATLAAAAAVNTTPTWTSGTPDPITDVMTANDTAQLLTGIYNNRILWAKDAWTKQIKAFGLSDNAAIYANRSLSPQQIAEVCMMDRGYVSKSVYQSAAAAKSRILAGLVLCFYGQDGADIEDPTNFKRFWSPTASGPVRVYSAPVGAKFIDIVVELYSQLVVTSAAGVTSLTPS